jgi:ATP-binding protein involved in chromosome partitioning
MSSQKEQEILQALRSVKDPDLGRDIVELGFVKNLNIEGDKASFAIELTTPACPVKDKLKEEAKRAALSVPGINSADIQMTARVRPSLGQQKEQLLSQVKNIIPVASGKGGVGKSTVSANLAVALVQMGAKVGLMDADVYGPSIPRIMGVKEGPKVLPGNRVTPPEIHGVKIMSMGFFIGDGEAIVWRGPMLHKTIQQFLWEVEWGELDYLVVDLPPGTGDVQLSICQTISLTGAAIVSTPQDVALKVAEKAIVMFNKLNTPILGMIENMSGYICSHCGLKNEIFGSGGARQYSLQRGIPFLGEIPLDGQVCRDSDSGSPVVISSPVSSAADAFRLIAQNLAAQVSIRNLGGADSNRLAPKSISQSSPDKIEIVWNDGQQKQYTARDLRLACRCAVCLDEMNGKPLLKPESVKTDLILLRIDPVGRYALRFFWSDGHSTGIYTFDYLRSL